MHAASRTTAQKVSLDVNLVIGTADIPGVRNCLIIYVDMVVVCKITFDRRNNSISLKRPLILIYRVSI